MIRIFILSMLFIAPSIGQTIIKGHVTDLETGQPLPAANIQIVGQYRGAISNTEGKYILELDRVPSSVLISYIGYESIKLTIEKDFSGLLNIRLKPIILETEAIVVTAEDPAMGIMREVIRRKLIWREKLSTFRADAYSRVVLENDSGIVSISESISKAFWDKEKGTREVLKSRRQTENVKAEFNFARANHIANFYDDDIELGGFSIIGPTHPDAFDYYRYKLLGKRQRDDNIIFDIEVIPTSLLQPTFLGTVAVLDQEFALLEIDLLPNETVQFPPPIREWNLFYKQQFSNFGEEFWLPVDVRVNGDIKFGVTGFELPKIIYSQISHLNDYKVNVALPDSLYEKDKIVTIDSSRIDSAEIFDISANVIPLSVEEDSAYVTLDSTKTMEKAFKPSGFLANLAKVTTNDGDQSDGEKSFLSDFGIELWYNRVDAFHLGLTFKKKLENGLYFELLTAYNTGSERWAYGGNVGFGFLKSTLNLNLSYLQNTQSTIPIQNYPFIIASALPLFATAEYYDYFWNEKYRVELAYKIKGTNISLYGGFNHEKHYSLDKVTDYNLIGKGFIQRENPAIDEGELNSFDLKIVYGGERVPFGVVGQKRIEVNFEYAQPKYAGGDFNFSRIYAEIDWRFNTFLQRRFLPITVDFRIIGGYTRGTLPSQRLFSVDGNLHAFSPFGVLRSLRGQPYQGSGHFAVFAEHNFRTVPFELLGLDFLVSRGISFLVHGATGRTWQNNLIESTSNYRYQNQFHSEVGISVSGIFDFIRLDATQRLDKYDFFIGVGLSRFL